METPETISAESFENAALPVQKASTTISRLIRNHDEEFAAAEKYTVHLPQWTGPYDLLLKVIDEQELNLFDLNIFILLDHYLEHLKDLKTIDLDEAGEFILVGATLAQIKSKMLLPVEEKDDEEEEEDPRAKLVQYLLEYQRIKQAADQLRDRPILGRDTFVKGSREVFEALEGEGQGKLFQLVKGFQRALKRATPSAMFEVEQEEVSVSDRFQEIFDLLESKREVSFEAFLPEGRGKVYLIASFLAVLELVRMKKVFVLQRVVDGPLFIRFNEGATGEDVIHSEFDEEVTGDEEESSVSEAQSVER